MGDNEEHRDTFPWDLGVHDAHCHPTDTMSSISSIAANMRARTLTVMATRSQDQGLVDNLAKTHGVNGRGAVTDASAQSVGNENPQKVIPCFGWHPWFSHQLYDDVLLDKSETTFDPTIQDQKAQKRRHYNAVLSPSPESKEDEGFIDELPDPQPLSGLIGQTRAYLEAHPFALVGEIGLDKAFRLPSHGPAMDDEMTPGRRNGQRLSPYRVNMDHQKRIFLAQLNLAGEMGRPVSVHGVQAPGILFDTLKFTFKGHERRIITNREKKMIAPGVNENFSSSDDDEDATGDDKYGRQGQHGPARKRKKYKPKPFPPRICLHSFSSGVQTLYQYINDRSIPAEIFFSFSLLVNYSSGGHEHERKKHIADEVIRACPDARILLESDLHTAGPEMDDMLEQIYRKACIAKGWGLRDGVERIGKNFEEFIFGN
ncbi:Cut9-interacting protein scn1 [Gnomoniopsis smithogilvyi]|uniref:Cut9-interacting protein scn1 n=1 Tax=Gnomoniopsis smithogilvyi TaxID=1191159 RepID=A0A9W8YQL6_9PEZI|nr:Cut9-interacting protein scn1 [Gnomoniopsis smithogilvyi]